MGQRSHGMQDVYLIKLTLWMEAQAGTALQAGKDRMARSQESPGGPYQDPAHSLGVPAMIAGDQVLTIWRRSLSLTMAQCLLTTVGTGSWPVVVLEQVCYE
jgi:hypothetical protein